MGISKNDIVIATEINSLRNAINTELRRRDKYSFTFDNSLNFRIKIILLYYIHHRKLSSIFIINIKSNNSINCCF